MNLGSRAFRPCEMPPMDTGKEIMFTSTAATHQPMALALFLLSTRRAAQSDRQSHGEPGMGELDLRLLFHARVAVERAEDQASANNGEYRSEDGCSDSGRKRLICGMQKSERGKKTHAQQKEAQKRIKRQDRAWTAWSQAIFPRGIDGRNSARKNDPQR